MSGTPTPQPVSRLQSVNANQQLRAAQQLPQENLTSENIWLRSGNYQAGSLLDPNVPVAVGSLQEFFGQIGLSVQGFFQDLAGGYQPSNEESVIA